MQHTFRHNLMAKRAERARQEYHAKFHPGSSGTIPGDGSNGSELDIDAFRQSGSQKEYEPSPTPTKGASAAAAAGGGGHSAPTTPKSGDSLLDNNDEDKDNMAVDREESSGVVPSLFGLFSSPQPTRIKGKKVFANGDVYEGELVDGVMDGKGTYKYHEGAIYIGQLKKGMRDGYGEYQSVNGERYIGYFRRNKRHGQGTKFHLDGRVDYGEWLN